MTLRKYLLSVIIMFIPASLLAQETKPFDYTKADSLALSVKYDGDISLLTKQLTAPLPDKMLKARAIFRWITENIGYDYKYFDKYYYKGKEPKTYRCNDDSLDCAIRKNVWETGYISKVLDEKKAVCQGYAMVFKKMCNLAGIEAEVIPGYVRTEYYEIGTMGTLDHAWNAFKIDGVYYLVDPTWAAGGCAKDDDEKLISFEKQYNDYYWLTPPDDFVRNHFPEDTKWVLIPKYTKEKFSANPFYEPAVIRGIRLITPATGIIAAKKGETIRFKLDYTGPVNKVQINSNIFRNPEIWYWDYISRHKREKKPDTLALKKQQYIKYTHNGYRYEFDYAVKDNTLDYLEILFDSERVLRFRVRVQR